MINNRHILLGLLAATSLGLSQANAQSFASKSVLAEGNWTKVSIQNTGLYEISYSKLREMGFSDPSKVAVYGQGGRMYSEDLYSGKKGQIYYDDLKQVPVIHTGDKLYFYGLGLENIEYKAQSGVMYFDNSGLNIYTDKGFYFLSDSAPAKNIEKLTANPSAITGSLSVNDGLWYTYHEIDLQQGHEKNGQLFWGEDLSQPGDVYLEWDADMRDAIPDAEGVMAVEIYKEKESQFHLKYGLVNGSGGMDADMKRMPNLTYFEPCKPRFASVFAGNSDTDKVYIELGDGQEITRTTDLARLDYWVLTYRRAIPTLSGNRAQDAILFDSMTAGSNCNFTIADKGDLRVLQVSDPYNVTELQINEYGPEGRVNFTADTDNPIILVFNPAQQQMQIGDYEQIQNQNLHAKAAEGAELLIIATNEMKDYAEMHAEVHRRINGTKVLVTDLETLYNEFSGGRPDPMAYRGISSMMSRNSDTPLKNILFYGPATGDIRSSARNGYGNSLILLPHNRKNRIAFDHGGSTIFDFAGFTANEISHLQFENAAMNVGVGYLTIKTGTEAEIARKKVEHYLTDPSRAYWINRMLSMGCDGDNHNHEEQAQQTVNAFGQSNYNASVVTSIMVDDNGNRQAGEMLIKGLEDGVNMFQYMGHAGAAMLGQEPSFHVGQITQLRNRVLPVIGFAGCDLTLPDRDMRGIAERIVLDTEHGGIACIATNRQAWSGPNVELANTILRKWGWDDSNPAKRLEAPQTIGELYARAKSGVKQSNELAYMLIGDPAVVLPVVTREVQLDLRTAYTTNLVPGRNLEIKGCVAKHNGDVDETFNGEAVIRILEPELNLDSRSFIKNETTSIPISYGDFQATIAVVDVKNGRFETEIRIPEYLNRFKGKNARVAVGAYDNNTRMGGAGASDIAIATNKQVGMPEPEADTEAPVIAGFEYNSDSHILVATVTDNVAVSTTTSSRMRPAYKLEVDGKSIGSDQTPRIINTPCGIGATLEFQLPDLDYGDHTAEIEVSDQSGNRTKANCSFSINPSWAKITLKANDDIADGKITFGVQGAIDNQLTLHILDSNGIEIYTTTTGNREIEWNCCDNRGTSVAPGLYKAYVRESGRPGYRAHSQTILVPVI